MRTKNNLVIKIRNNNGNSSLPVSEEKVVNVLVNNGVGLGLRAYFRIACWAESERSCFSRIPCVGR